MIIQCLSSGSKGNAYVIDDSHTRLLLECGIPFKKIQEGCGFRLHEIQACLVSHGHGDHCKAARDIMKAGIDLYLSPETASFLGLSGHRVNEIEDGGQVQIGSWIIRAFRAQHDIEGCLGFLLHSMELNERLLYLTDSFYSRYVFVGLTHIMLEINYDMQTLNENVASGLVPVEMKNRLLQSHFSLENAVEFLKANDLSKVREIQVIHMSEGNCNAERVKRTLQAKFGKPVYIMG